MMAEMVVGGILHYIGGFGLYQKFLCICVVGAVNWLCALTFATHLFSLMAPDHWCWDPSLASLEEQLPLDQQDGKKFSVPVIRTRFLPWTEAEEVSFSQCQRYDGDLVGAYLGWMVAKRPSHFVPKTPIQGRPYSTRECSEGWTYNHTFHTLVTENDWVCNLKWKVYAIHAAFWLGAVVGAITSKYTINRFGRRPSLIAGMLVYSIGGGVTLLTPEFTPLSVSRFIIGMGHFSSCFLSLQLVMELCDEKHRIIPFVVMMMAHTIGTLSAPWIAQGLSSWWWLTFITTTFSAFLVLFLTWAVPESPWWLCKKGNHEYAKTILQKIAQLNKKEHEKINHKLLEDLVDFWSKDNERVTRHGLTHSSSRNDLLNSEEMKTSSKGQLVINIIWSLCVLCYYGNYHICEHLVATALDSRSSSSDILLSFWYAALVEIPIWIFPFILQGRPLAMKVILGISLATSAAVGIYYALLPTGYPEISLILGLLSRFSVSVAYYSAFQKKCESNDFDTTMGAPVEMIVSVLPCIVFMEEYYRRIPTFIFGIISSLTAIVSLFSPMRKPETRHTIILKKFRYLMHTKRFRRMSISLMENEEEDTQHSVSTVPYSHLETM